MARLHALQLRADLTSTIGALLQEILPEIQDPVREVSAPAFPPPPIAERLE